MSALRDAASVRTKETPLKAQKKSSTVFMTCKDEVALLAAYLSGILNAGLAGAFEAHLQQCSDCAAFLRTYEKTIEASKRFLNISRAMPTQPLRLRQRSPGSRVTFMVCLMFFCSVFIG